jgi:hypothetical protein
MGKNNDKSVGAKLLEDAKNNVNKKQEKQKETQTMKTNKLQTIITVAVTLVSVAALFGAFYLGTQFQNGVNHEVSSQVKELAAVISSKK